MESAWRGASGMDAARGPGVPAIKGHGWPLQVGPRSDTGGRGPGAKRRAGCRGALSFAYFSLRKQRKVSRPGGRNQGVWEHSVIG